MLSPLHHRALPDDATSTLLQRAPSADAAPSVSLRDGANVDPTVLRVAGNAAVKHNTFTSRPGYPSSSAHWQTHLHLDAWVANTTYAKNLWVDVHVFGHDGALVSSETRALEYASPAGDGGDLFRVDCAIYEGATATPGLAEPRPDVRLVQYRLYTQLDGQVFTDGLVHECALKSDVVSH